jgi:hypothetical protein
MKKGLIAVIVFWVFIAGVQLGIRHGRDLGYSQGWSDAHCGKGLDCEAGQE